MNVPHPCASLQEPFLSEVEGAGCETDGIALQSFRDANIPTPALRFAKMSGEIKSKSLSNPPRLNDEG